MQLSRTRLVWERTEDLGCLRDDSKLAAEVGERHGMDFRGAARNTCVVGFVERKRGIGYNDDLKTETTRSAHRRLNGDICADPGHNDALYATNV